MSSPRLSAAIACRARSSWARQSQRSEPSTSPVKHCEWMRTSGASPRRSPSASTTAVSTRPEPFPTARSNPRAWNTPQRVGMRAAATQRSVGFAVVERVAFIGGLLLDLSFLGPGCVLLEERRENRADFVRAHALRELLDLEPEGLFGRLARAASQEPLAGLNGAGRLRRQGLRRLRR